MKIRNAVFGTTALVVLLTAGAAQSLSGSNTVYTDDIVDHNITAADLGTNSVTRAALGDNAVSTNEVANGAITNLDLSDNAVTTAKIADDTVTTADVLDGTVSADDLAAAAVTSSKLADGAVGAGKLNSSAVYFSAYSTTVDPQGYIHGKCAFGDLPIGVQFVNDDGIVIGRSFKNGSDWLIAPDSSGHQISVSAVCLDLTP